MIEHFLLSDYEQMERDPENLLVIESNDDGLNPMSNDDTAKGFMKVSTSTLLGILDKFPMDTPDREYFMKQSNTTNVFSKTADDVVTKKFRRPKELDGPSKEDIDEFAQRLLDVLGE